MLNKKNIIFIPILIFGLGICFSQAQAGSITVTTPGTLTAGSSYSISWTASGTTGQYAIYLCSGSSVGNCENSYRINSPVSGNSYSWVVPTSLATGSNYRINIYDWGSDIGFPSAYSGSFTINNSNISSAALTAPILISPSSGSTVNSLTPSFQWNASSGAGAYIWEIMYVDSNILTTNQTTVGSGKLSWGQTYTWRVKACTDSSMVSCGDWSQGAFTTQQSSVTKQITVISPNGGEKWTIGETHDITWASVGIDKVNISIEFSGAGGLGIITNSISASLGRYSWKADTTSGNNNAQNKIIVSDASDSSISDKSNDYFTILPAGTSSTTSAGSCDSSSYTNSSSAFDFQAGGSKTSLCGDLKYFKITIPSGKTCGVKWTLISDSNSDYDLYIKNDSSLTRNVYSSRSTEGKGKEDVILQTGLSAGTYYAMVYKETGTTGSYSIVAAMPNCLGASSTTTTTTTSTSTASNSTTSQSSTTNTASSVAITQAQATQLQTQIDQLLVQIAQLQAELAKLKSGTTSQSSAQAQSSTQVNSSSNISNWCHSFTTTLKYGDKGYEVGALQAALQKEGLYSGAIGGYSASFGNITLSSTIAFQEKYRSEILTSINLTKGTGYVGSSTIKKLNQLYGCK